MAEVISVRPSQLKEALKVCLEVRQPAFIHGSPGIGKSDMVRQVASDMGLPLKDDRAVLKDPVDLRGLPHVNGDNRAHWAQPEEFPRNGKGIWFMDELNRAPILVQNAYFQLILDRRLGEYELPEGWRLLAAGNRESDGGGVTRMPSALVNRFIHFNLEVDIDEWCDWAVQAAIEPVVLAFMRYRPNLLHNFDRNSDSFPTPRSWEFVSRVIGKRMSQEVELAMVSGAVGQGAAVEFAAFIKLFRTVPNIDSIILDPMNAPVPRENATLYAVTAALGMRAKTENFGRIIQYLDRIQPEFAVFAVKDAVSRDKDLTKTPEFTKWAIAHKDLM